MSIDFKKQEYKENFPLWQKCRDVVAGEEKVHSKGEIYLPKLSGQTTKEYEAYCLRASFYNASSRTIDGMTGLLFRKMPVQDIPEVLNNIIYNIDMKGNSLLSFAEKTADEVLQVGRVGVLVEYPKVVITENEKTKADAEAQNLRPYLVQYKAESIINWATKIINNVKIVSLVVIEEKQEKYIDSFETEIEIKYRVLTLDENNNYLQRIFVKKTDTTGKNITFIQEGDDIYPLMNGSKMNYIPFVFINSNGLDPEISKAPLIDLVNVNLSHYRTSADIEHAAHYTALPVPVITGHNLPEGTNLKIGSSEAWVLPEENAKAYYLEYSGDGIQSLEKRLEKKEQMMASLGARMLATEKAAAETAETHTIKRQGENSALASIANSISNGLTRALEIIAEWSGIDPNPIFIEINKDFVPTAMTPQALVALLQAYQSRAIGFSDFVKQLQKGEIVDSDRTPEDIMNEIELNPILVDNSNPNLDNNNQDIIQ